MDNDLPAAPRGWSWVPLGQLCERVTVGYVSSTRAFFCAPGEGVRLVRSQNIRPGRLILDDTAWVSREFHEANPKSHLKPGDVLVTRVGANAGDVCIVPQGVGDLHCSSAVFARPLKRHAKFLELFCRSPLGQNLLKARIVGSVSERINTRDVEDLPVLSPPLDEQKAIAEVLGALDDKIELNRRMNATLEAMARAFFQSWFVDFDPIRTKIDGRAPANLAPATAALFPASFEHKDGELLPFGWKVRTVEDAMESIIDYRGKTPNKTTSGVPLVTAKVVKDGRILEFNEFIAEEDYDGWMRRGIPKPGDVVMTTEAPLGEVAQLDDRKVALAQRLITLRGKPGVVANPYLRFLMQSPGFQNELLARSSGTTVVGIRQSELRKIEISIPPFEQQVAFAELVSPMTSHMDRNWRHCETLATLRDTLLPKLLSGELSVPTAETMLDEAQ
jgi:restriction endonuclease S subunit